MIAKQLPAGAKALVAGVSLIALSSATASAEPLNKIAELESNGAYLNGDKHNHTTCTDGAMSVQTVVNESLNTYGLDWFAQTGHGGSGDRDCRFDDPEYDGEASGSGDRWVNTIGEENILGDENNGRMWRWQSITEYAYSLQKAIGETGDQPVWLGVEHNAPGHEHISMSILNGQFSNDNAYALGQFEYLFDRGDGDTSGGEENDFENPANNGIPKPGVAGGVFDSELLTGDAGHAVSVAAVEFLRDRYLDNAYYVPAHVERQGGFASTENRGYNVEHFRDFHTAGLFFPQNPNDTRSVVFGAEMIAGHQFANGGRGTYEADRPTAGLGTYGGAGAYSGAEVSVAGFDFDGNPISNATLNELRAELNALFEDRLTEPSGNDQYDQLDACEDCADPAPADIGTSLQERFVLGRPGVKTMWDALLGEGRRFFNFGSSDWHNRGTFGPFEPQSTLDPWPGEYNQLYAYVRGSDFGFGRVTSQKIVRGMRDGNSFSVMGDLIDEFFFVMCQGNKCATMGETLEVTPGGADIEWVIKLRDPEGPNFSPYFFANQSLAQIGIDIPTNEPMLSHIDVIRGDITGIIDPSDPAYTTNVSNPTTEIFATVDNDVNGDGSNADSEFEVSGEHLIASGTIPVSSIENDMYFRVRGTNMPQATPNETDADGNPLLDDFSSLIPCTATGEGTSDEEVADASVEALAVTGNSSFRARNAVNATFDPEACPDHLPVDAAGVKFLDADVEAWTDLWFYANPIFVEVR